MKVAKLVEPKKIEVFNEDLNNDLSEKEVLIKVKSVAICGTDLHIYKGERSDVELPRVMGHELSGQVEAVGSKVENIQTGDRVVVDPVVSCGTCHACKTGHHNVCESVKCLGVQVEGGFQDYIKLPEERVYKFSDSISWNEAALIEPLACAAQMTQRGRVQAGDKVVIIGAGAIGLSALLVCKLLGAEVLISDLVDSRLELAKNMRADLVVNSKAQDVKEEVNLFTDGRGADVVLDAVGYAKFLELSVELAAPAARIVVIGFDENTASIPQVVITKKELEIIGSRMNNLKFPMVIKWLENKELDPKDMISSVYDIENIDKAFSDVVNDPNGIIKSIITF